VDLVFEPAWGTREGEADCGVELVHVQEMHLADGLSHADEVSHGRAALKVSRRAAHVVLDVAQCLQVSVERFKVMNVNAEDNLMRLQVSGGESLGRAPLDQEPTHALVARLVAATVDQESALRQCPGLSLLRYCRVHTSPGDSTLDASRQLVVGTSASAGISHLSAPRADVEAVGAGLALPAYTGGLGWEAPVSDARWQQRRLTPAELQQGC